MEKTLTISNLFSEMQNSIYWPRYFDFREYAFFREETLYSTIITENHLFYREEGKFMQI